MIASTTRVVVAGAMAALPQLARQLASASLTGFEWAVGVPGSVGGAVRMNAGGHGSDMAACLVAVTLVDLREHAVAAVPVSRLGLRFRGSDIANHQVVVDATIQLAHGDRDASERKSPRSSGGVASTNRADRTVGRSSSTRYRMRSPPAS